MPETWIPSALSTEESENLNGTIDNIPDSTEKSNMASAVSTWTTTAFTEGSYDNAVEVADAITNETSKTDVLIQLDNVGGLLVANGGPRRPTVG